MPSPFRNATHRPHQPLLQDADATKAALVQELPIAYQACWFVKRKASFKGLHDIDEGLAVFGVFTPVLAKHSKGDRPLLT